MQTQAIARTSEDCPGIFRAKTQTKRWTLNVEQLMLSVVYGVSREKRKKLIYEVHSQIMISEGYRNTPVNLLPFVMDDCDVDMVDPVMDEQLAMFVVESHCRSHPSNTQAPPKGSAGSGEAGVEDDNTAIINDKASKLVL